MNFVTVIDEYDKDTDNAFRQLIDFQLAVAKKESDSTWSTIESTDALESNPQLLKQQKQVKY